MRKHRGCVLKKNSDNLAGVSRANRLAIEGWARLPGTTMVHPHRGVIYGAAVRPQGNCTGAAGEPAAWTPSARVIYRDRVSPPPTYLTVMHKTASEGGVAG